MSERRKRGSRPTGSTRSRPRPNSIYVQRYLAHVRGNPSIQGYLTHIRENPSGKSGFRPYGLVNTLLSRLAASPRSRLSGRDPSDSCPSGRHSRGSERRWGQELLESTPKGFLNPQISTQEEGEAGFWLHAVSPQTETVQSDGARLMESTV